MASQKVTLQKGIRNTPKGIRIPVGSVKGCCPRPLDDGGMQITLYQIPFITTNVFYFSSLMDIFIHLALSINIMIMLSTINKYAKLDCCVLFANLYPQL